MKVALLQTNPTVGAVAENAGEVLALAARAKTAGADLAVTPELGLLGYPPRDLLDRPGFLRATRAATQRVVENAPRGLTLIVGGLGGSELSHGRRLTNDAIAIQDRAIIARASKQLLPTYDVFDEARHFEPGSETTSVVVGDQRVCLTVCEDVWVQSDSLSSRYRTDPLDGVSAKTTDLVVNLSASPFTLAKLETRPQLFSDLAKTRGIPIALINQVGGNDELLFDGRSAVWDAHGRLIARARMFEEDLVIVDLEDRGRIEPEATTEEEAAYRALVLGVRDYARKCGFNRAVIGLSGGIDSAVTAVIAADALGPENVIGVAMPTRYSSEGSKADATALAENLGVELRLVDIDPIFAAYLDQLSPLLDEITEPRESDVTLENIQARIRGATVMAISNRSGALVLTTGNKSEIAVGYCTLYGDMVGGLAVISDVPKIMVYAIARWINRDTERIPRSSIDKPPSAELRPDQTDEDSLPPYDVLDAVLELFVEQQLSRKEIVDRGFDAALVARIVHLVGSNEYKRRQAAPGLIITSKAFGPGRRMPVAQGYREE